MRGLFILFFFAANLLSAQKIVWSADKKLVWNNFKSNKNSLGGADVVAYTHCGWEYSSITSSDPKKPVKIEITTIFNEDKSWKDVKRINDYVLVHEQKHFDIAELHARKLRKELAEKITYTSDYKKYFKSIYARISNDYRKFQQRYDKETDHGQNKEKQAEYNIMIADALAELNNYQKI
ncbi:hypothetical protein ASG01_02400 [Chryseobacterium sp. Leaf180]|uniref:DUF922 domain-containing protein n=1 Tax=Chryseobacterium sp. Leaf180 TaxID=1736289 RepID=UPI0006F7DF4D|nr:DUF922 domain-containing protein [Chryseobacterium sp. Leaf180]KQR95659.1 hypothetical protein ASG01_02400 [Chryseobacterium sp. Leaf180]